MSPLQESDFTPQSPTVFICEMGTVTQASWGCWGQSASSVPRVSTVLGPGSLLSKCQPTAHAVRSLSLAGLETEQVRVHATDGQRAGHPTARMRRNRTKRNQCREMRTDCMRATGRQTGRSDWAGITRLSGSLARNPQTSRIL